jgi:Cu/Ag efflux protein CusF
MRMNRFVKAMVALCVAGALGSAAVGNAGTPATAPTGEQMVAKVEVTATVTKIDYATREVTLKAQDGQEYSFVASEDVRNLGQVKVGDRVHVAYAEALVYEVRKGGAAADGGTVIAGGAAQPGQKPAGAIARETKVTVLITAIDPKVPSVTFKGPGGNTRTIKVMHPEKLQGVHVGDTVDITYTEALAIKVEEAPQK